MPTTPKGLPYPASTAPPNVPADLQALAQDLDFTKVQVLTPAQVNAASLLSAYPLGLSLVRLLGADASAGGWPGATSSMVFTIKPHADRGTQFVFRNAQTLVNSYYRQLITDPGPHSAWVSASAPFGSYVGSATLDASTNPTAGVLITFPAGRFTLTPRVVLGSGNSAWAPSSSAVSTTGVTILARQIIANSTNPLISVYAVQATDQSITG